MSFQLSVASVSGIALLRAARWALRPRSRPGSGAPAPGLAVAVRGSHPGRHRCDGAPGGALVRRAGAAGPAGNLALVPLVELGVVPIGLFGRLGRRAVGAAGPVAAGDRGRRGPPDTGHRRAVPCARPRLGLPLAQRAGDGGGDGGRRPRWRCWRWPCRARDAGWWAAHWHWRCSPPPACLARDQARRRQPDLVITFLDVGQGDAAVIEAPGGAAPPIDGGGSRDGAFDTGARIVEPFLRARGIRATGRGRAVASAPRPPERTVPDSATILGGRVLVDAATTGTIH